MNLPTPQSIRERVFHDSPTLAPSPVKNALEVMAQTSPVSLREAFRSADSHLINPMPEARFRRALRTLGTSLNNSIIDHAVRFSYNKKTNLCDPRKLFGELGLMEETPQSSPRPSAAVREELCGPEDTAAGALVSPPEQDLDVSALAVPDQPQEQRTVRFNESHNVSGLLRDSPSRRAPGSKAARQTLQSTLSASSVRSLYSFFPVDSGCITTPLPSESKSCKRRSEASHTTAVSSIVRDRIKSPLKVLPDGAALAPAMQIISELVATKGGATKAFRTRFDLQGRGALSQDDFLFGVRYLGVPSDAVTDDEARRLFAQYAADARAPTGGARGKRFMKLAEFDRLLAEASTLDAHVRTRNEARVRLAKSTRLPEYDVEALKEAQAAAERRERESFESSLASKALDASAARASASASVSAVQGPGDDLSRLGSSLHTRDIAVESRALLHATRAGCDDSLTSSLVAEAVTHKIAEVLGSKYKSAADAYVQASGPSKTVTKESLTRFVHKVVPTLSETVISGVIDHVLPQTGDRGDYISKRSFELLTAENPGRDFTRSRLLGNVYQRIVEHTNPADEDCNDRHFTRQVQRHLPDRAQSASTARGTRKKYHNLFENVGYMYMDAPDRLQDSLRQSHGFMPSGRKGGGLYQTRNAANSLAKSTGNVVCSAVQELDSAIVGATKQEVHTIQRSKSAAMNRSHFSAALEAGRGSGRRGKNLVSIRKDALRTFDDKRRGLYDVIEARLAPEDDALDFYNKFNDITSHALTENQLLSLVRECRGPDGKVTKGAVLSTLGLSDLRPLGYASAPRTHNDTSDNMICRPPRPGDDPAAADTLVTTFTSCRKSRKNESTLMRCYDNVLPSEVIQPRSVDSIIRKTNDSRCLRRVMKSYSKTEAGHAADAGPHMLDDADIPRKGLRGRSCQASTHHDIIGGGTDPQESEQGHSMRRGRAQVTRSAHEGEAADDLAKTLGRGRKIYNACRRDSVTRILAYFDSNERCETRRAGSCAYRSRNPITFEGISPRQCEKE